MDNNGSTNFGSPGTLLGRSANTYSRFAAYNNRPTKIMRHEFAHLLYGGNNFQYAGGGNGNSGLYWIAPTGGWGNLSLFGSSLQTWSGWDRLQMGWMNPGQTNPVAARNAANTAEVNGDLDEDHPTDSIYILRDFVQTGDALRIKLPYTPSNKYPEFIWVENHQGRNANGDPFDSFQYEDAPCVEDAGPGLYMYVQIDREHRTDAFSANNLYGGYEEFARPLSAVGAYDMGWVTAPPVSCVGGADTSAFVRAMPNPLTGMSDTHSARADRNGNGQLNAGERSFHDTEYDAVMDEFDHNLFCFGHPRQAFTPSGNHKLGIGTNPSSASMKSKRGFETDAADPKNLEKVYLNGISVELVGQLSDGSIKVRVRFDDVDIVNDTRWCADSIELNPIPTTNGISLNLTTGNTLLLDQGLTATRRRDPIPYNGLQIFANPTLMRCLADSWFNLEPNSEVVVANGSTLRLEDGSHVDIANGAVLRVKRGGRLELMGNSTLNVAAGGKVIIEEDVVNGNDGRLVYYPNARINLEETTAEIEFAGTLEIKDNATFTLGRLADPAVTHGSIRFSNTDATSNNIVAGTNSRFVLRSDNMFRQLLVVEQESIYGPSELVEFTLRKCTAKLADQARIVPPVVNSCAINFIDARITSISVTTRNTHRGVRLNGQPFLTLSGSTFSKGAYGLYCFNSTLHSRPAPTNCSFYDCGTGMYNYDTGILATNCSFNSCDNGLRCDQMSQTSKLISCTAVGNAYVGVQFNGSATLRVEDPLFNGNHTGLILGQATGKIFCGSISENADVGIDLRYGATLRMDGTSGAPHDPVTLLGNNVTIACHNANQCYLNNGHNSLKPDHIGMQLTLNGTFLCQPYAVNQIATSNNWNGAVGAALTAADYRITSCGSPLNFIDPSSSTEIPCGTAIDHGHDTIPADPDDPVDLLADCPSCGLVETELYGIVPLNIASSEAMATADNDSLPNNEKEALVGLNQILMNNILDPSIDEKRLLNEDYDRMKESFSDGLMKGQLSTIDSTSDTGDHLALVEQVQGKRIQDATGEDYAEFRLYTELERAQANRAAGKLENALDELGSIVAVTSSEENDLIAHITCLTQIENNLKDGLLGWNDVETAMEQCGIGSVKSISAGQFEDDPAKIDITPKIHPNPASTELTVEGYPGQDCTLRIFDAIGRDVIKEIHFSGNTVLSVLGLSPGLYLYQILTDQGNRWTDRLVIGR